VSSGFVSTTIAATVEGAVAVRRRRAARGNLSAPIFPRLGAT